MKIVYFDLETSGTSLQEIIQIGAKYNEKQFNQYITPDGPITDRAYQIHGIGKNGGQLYNQHGKTLPGCAPDIGYQRFLNFLFRIKGQSRRIILCAHNCRRFDSEGRNNLLYDHGNF